jgi:AcrR family transcriptional regulator
MSQQEAGITAGLRERKKQRTRETIVDAAFKLFAERGFDATTIADIAAAADIAPRTFFGYFATKEDVVTHDFGDIRASMRARLQDREPGETAIDALRAWVVDLMGRVDFADPRETCRQQLLRESEALRAHDRHLRAGVEDLLAESIAEDLGEDADSLRARMVAAATIAAFERIQDFYGEKGAVKHSAEAALAIFDEALVFARGGIRALQAQPPSASLPPGRGRARRGGV